VGNLTDSETITLTATDVNEPPFWTPSQQEREREPELASTCLRVMWMEMVASLRRAPEGATLVDGTLLGHRPIIQAALTLTFTLPTMELGINCFEPIVITVNNVNERPVLASIGQQECERSCDVGFRIIRTDVDGDGLTFSSQPSEWRNADRRSFRWTPTYQQQVPTKYLHGYRRRVGNLTDSET